LNRIFALPAKLGTLDIIKISKGTGAFLDKIGVWALFIVIAIFAVWVVGTFFMNIGVLKGREEAS
jgi:hypothetical protein